KEAFLVQITDVADADQTFVLHGTALALVAFVGEVGEQVEPGVDLARLARPELGAVLAHDLHARAGERAPDRAGVGEPLLARAVGDRARLGAAVVLGDDRAETPDHG